MFLGSFRIYSIIISCETKRPSRHIRVRDLVSCQLNTNKADCGVVLLLLWQEVQEEPVNYLVILWSCDLVRIGAANTDQENHKKIVTTPTHTHTLLLPQNRVKEAVHGDNA